MNGDGDLVVVQCRDCPPDGESLREWAFQPAQQSLADAFAERHHDLQGHRVTIADRPGFDALLALGDAGDTTRSLT